MKISKERLKQIIQEEIEAEIEEGLLGNLALGLATAMHGGAKPIPTSADIPSLDTGEPEAAQVMQAPKEGLSDDGESFTGLLFDDAPYTPRQVLPITYQPNGAIYWFSLEQFLITGKIPRHGVFPYVMQEADSVDIDTIEDFQQAEKILKSKG